MEQWMKLSLILCFFGFLKEIRPSEPYIYEFLSGPWRNISGQDVVTNVYPVGTYGYLILLVVIFLITDLLRYRPLIVVLGISGVVFSAMLLWTTSLFALQVMEVFYSLFMAAEVAYYTYIYSKVDKEHYASVTSHTRASLLIGRFVSGVLSQLLISLELMDFKQLNYITFAAMILATFWSFLLPSVKKSIYFHRIEEGEVKLNGKERFHKGISLMKEEIFESFKSATVIKWSIWYALGTGLFLQVQSYMQPLWSNILGDPEKKMYNGAVEAVLTLFGFCFALLAGVLKVDWAIKGDILRIIVCTIQGIIIVMASQTSSIYECYVCYIIYGMLYHFVITVTSSEIAKKVREDTFGLIFGFNTFIAMIFQSLLTLVVVTDIFDLKLDVRQQYFFYGCCCFVVALLDVFAAIFRCFFGNHAGFQIDRPNT